jgi:hypothetical protein
VEKTPKLFDNNHTITRRREKLSPIGKASGSVSQRE